MSDSAIQLAEHVRQSCLQAALQAYEQARMDGLCDEGALEFALDAIRRLDMGKIMTDFHTHPKETP